MGCSHDHSLKPAACSRTPPFMALGKKEKEKEKEKGEGNTMEKILGETPVYVKELIAGGIAGGFAKTAVAPLERIKILFQTRHGEFQSLGVRRSLGWILRTEGVRGLYRGNGASVARIVPYAALHFMTYEQYRRWIIENYPGIGTGPIIDLLAGSFAGGTAVMCTYPLDLARTRLAYQVTGSHTMDMDNKVRRAHFQPPYRGIIDVFKIVYRESGLRGLYRGVGPSLYGIFPYAGLKFYVYEDLKRHIPKKDENSMFVKLACGSVAGLVGQTITYPLDVVRRQMQVQTLLVIKDGPSSLQLMDHEFKGTWDGLMTVVQRQGWRQLFSGLSINYLKVVPSVAIGFTAYDAMKSFLGIPSRASAHSQSKE